MGQTVMWDLYRKMIHKKERGTSNDTRLRVLPTATRRSRLRFQLEQNAASARDVTEI
jgi:hypothetical protein